MARNAASTMSSMIEHSQAASYLITTYPPPYRQACTAVLPKKYFSLDKAKLKFVHIQTIVFTAKITFRFVDKNFSL